MARKPSKPEEGTVRALGRGGDGVVEMPGGLWMVPGTLPRERVVARAVSTRAGVTRGKLSRVLEPSPGRVDPECPHQRACGGCPLMHADEGLEREIKQGWVQDLLQRLDVQGVTPSWFPSEATAGYRTRARLFWTRSAQGRVRAGFHRTRSQEVVDIPDCRVLHSALDAAWQGFRERLADELSGHGEVALSLGAAQRAAVVLRAGEMQSPALYAACEAWVASGEVAGVALWVGDGTQPAVWGQPEERLSALDGSPLVGSVGGFSQANAGVNAKLVAYVRELAETDDASVLELYAGHGNFSVALAAGSGSYTAVEQEAEAAQRCVDNTRERGLSVKVIAGDAAAHLERGALDVLLLDPPRTGARGVLHAALSRSPRRIVYVSCNLATLERDLREVAGEGYRVDRAAGFDMFPRTAQLETVVRLVRDA